MGVVHPNLVLHEKVRALELPDIVIMRPHSSQQPVSTDCLRGSLREVPHENAVMIRPRRLHHHPPQERVIRIGELQEADGGCYPERL